MKKYKTMGLSPQIDSYEIKKETVRYVWYYKNDQVVMERKSHKYWQWHNSYNEAKVFLMNKISNEIDEVESGIDNLEARWCFAMDAYTSVKNSREYKLRLVVNRT